MVDQGQHPSVYDPDGWAASGKDWASQSAVTIGESVARWRGRRKLSAQRLAERCNKLGMPSLTRTVITKLENGRKESVSTAELAILATALDVPPVILMFPIGERDTVDVTPGWERDPLDAIYWFSGLSAELYGQATENGSALDFFIMHRRIVDAVLGQHGIWQGLQGRWLPPISAIKVKKVTLEDFGLPPLPEEERLVREMQQNLSYLRTIRDAIRKLGLNPPSLPPELANFDEKSGS